MTPLQEAESKMLDAIDANLKAHERGGVVTGYVLFATYMDEDGDKSYLMDELDEQPASMGLGMYESGAAILRAVIVRNALSDAE